MLNGAGRSMGTRRDRVLITDDGRGFIALASAMLRKMGFTVIPAEDGREAVNLTGVMAPDLVLLDTDMPVMDGVSALGFLKRNLDTFAIPVVMVSEGWDVQLIEECRRLGCMAYLVKPVEAEELHDVIQECLYPTRNYKRKHLRVMFDKEVNVYHGGKLRSFHAETLSAGGLFMGTEECFPLGSELDIVLPLEDGMTVPVRGRVIHASRPAGEEQIFPPGMGVAFSGLSSEQSAAVGEYVRRLASAQG